MTQLRTMDLPDQAKALLINGKLMMEPFLTRDPAIHIRPHFIKYTIILVTCKSYTNECIRPNIWSTRVEIIDQRKQKQLSI